MNRVALVEVDRVRQALDVEPVDGRMTGERADPLLTVSTRAARHFDLLTVYAEFINLLDSDKKEIVYSYPAFVAGLDPAGLSADDIDCSQINCRMSRVTEPRTFRLGVSYKFR